MRRQVDGGDGDKSGRIDLGVAGSEPNPLTPSSVTAGSTSDSLMEGRRVEELLLADFFNESKPLVFLAPFAFGAIVLRQKQKVVRLRDATTIPKTSCH